MTVFPAPAPCSVNPFVFGTVTLLVQAQFPDGTVTVSPSVAELIADWILVLAHDAAPMVAACAELAHPHHKRIAKNRHRAITGRDPRLASTEASSDRPEIHAVGMWDRSRRHLCKHDARLDPWS